MICSKCGSHCKDNAAFCPECGERLTGAAEVQYGQPIEAASEPEVQYGQPIEAASEPEAQYGQPVEAASEPEPHYGQPAGAAAEPVQEPAYQQHFYSAQPVQNRVVLPCSRGLLKYILLTIITCGIYAAVVQSRLVDELNIAASSYDGKRTPSITEAGVYTALTLGIYAFVWNHKFAKRIGAELARRGIGYGFGASTFWLWGILGALIIVGPLVYTHKLFKATNLINAQYNAMG